MILHHNFWRTCHHVPSRSFIQGYVEICEYYFWIGNDIMYWRTSFLMEIDFKLSYISTIALKLFKWKCSMYSKYMNQLYPLKCMSYCSTKMSSACFILAKHATDRIKLINLLWRTVINVLQVESTAQQRKTTEDWCHVRAVQNTGRDGLFVCLLVA